MSESRVRENRMHGSIGGRWQRRDDDAGAAGPRPAAGTRRHHGLVGTSTATTNPSEPAPYLTDLTGGCCRWGFVGGWPVVGWCCPGGVRVWSMVRAVGVVGAEGVGAARWTAAQFRWERVAGGGASRGR